MTEYYISGTWYWILVMYVIQERVVSKISAGLGPRATIDTLRYQVFLVLCFCFVLCFFVFRERLFLDCANQVIPVY